MTIWEAFFFLMYSWMFFLLCHISLYMLISAKIVVLSADWWCSRWRCLHVCLFFKFFFSCCLSPLNSTDYCWSCVCVYACACVCVLCFEAITVAACDVAVTRACVLVCVHFRPCCVVCLRCTVRMSAARNLSISPARYSGTSVLISGAGRFSVQPVCSWEHCKS